MNLSPTERMKASGVTARLASLPPLIWALVLTLVCLVPFINKAVHIDDTLFIRAAEQIQRHPADFYGFNVNWYGSTTPMVQTFENPPLACYFIALAAGIAGWSEPALHLAFLLIALAAAAGTFLLAQHYCARPLLACVAAVLTPVFLISATTLMCDVLLVAFWTWSLAFFESGLRKGRWPLFLTSGLLAGLAVLTKFFGLALVPLLLVYGFLHRRRAGMWLCAPLAPILFAAGYEWLTYRLYGKGLLLGAAAYCSDVQTVFASGLLQKSIFALVFGGGCFLPLLLYTPLLWSRRAVLGGIGGSVVAATLVPFLKPVAPLVWTQAQTLDWGMFLHVLAFLVAGLFLLLLAGADCWKRRHCTSVLLLLWVFGTFVFAGFLNWTLNGRSFLPMGPALGILIARRLELHAPNPRKTYFGYWPAIPAAVLTLLLTKADYDLAGASRTAATQCCSKYRASAKGLWFEGHWGFQYYMEQHGAKALDLAYHRLVPGEIIVLPSPSSSVVGLPSDLVRLLETYEFPPRSDCSTMDPPANAGFYCSLFGRLPFVFGSSQAPRFCVYEVTCADELAELQHLGQGESWDETIRRYQAAVDAHPADPKARFELADLLASRSRTAEAITCYRAGLRLKADSPEALNNLAWILATGPEPKTRNGPEAIHLAEQACALTHRKTAICLGTLAAAYAEAGDFTHAVATASEAAALAESEGHSELAGRNRELLELYRGSRAFHQNAPAPHPISE